MTTHVFGSSAIGPLHIHMNMPCQDACAYAVLPSNSAVIAVADGLGSACKSEIGAKLAVETAIATVREKLAPSDSDGILLEEIVTAAVYAARNALEQKALEQRWPLRDLACTIIVVAFDKDRLAIAHIGDGAVVAQAQDGLRLLSGPGESEYTNEVVPLTSAEWQQSLRIVPTVYEIECVAVFTDGCQRAAFRKSSDRLEPFEGFFAPIFSYAQELPDLDQAVQEIHSLLSSKKVCENSEDDKTLVIAVMGRG